MGELTHFDEKGNAVMVDVTEKPDTVRQATAEGKILVSREIFERIKTGGIEKGDVLNVARIAGIMGTKRTSELIPMCHILLLTKSTLDFTMQDGETPYVLASCTVKTTGKTGVEMEALCGVTTALLTIYDMCKAVDKHMQLTDIHLVRKSGGKSGDFEFEKETL